MLCLVPSNTYILDVAKDRGDETVSRDLKFCLIADVRNALYAIVILCRSGELDR